MGRRMGGRGRVCSARRHGVDLKSCWDAGFPGAFRRRDDGGGRGGSTAPSLGRIPHACMPIQLGSCRPEITSRGKHLTCPSKGLPCKTCSRLRPSKTWWAASSRRWSDLSELALTNTVCPNQNGVRVELLAPEAVMIGSAACSGGSVSSAPPATSGAPDLGSILPLQHLSNAPAAHGHQWTRSARCLPFWGMAKRQSVCPTKLEHRGRSGRTPMEVCHQPHLGTNAGDSMSMVQDRTRRQVLRQSNQVAAVGSWSLFAASPANARRFQQSWIRIPGNPIQPHGADKAFGQSYRQPNHGSTQATMATTAAAAS